MEIFISAYSISYAGLNTKYLLKRKENYDQNL